MSLIVAIVVPDGIVLATDSRTTVQSTQNGIASAWVLTDSAEKICACRRVAVATWGNALTEDNGSATAALKQTLDAINPLDPDPDIVINSLQMATELPSFVVAGYSDEFTPEVVVISPERGVQPEDFAKRFGVLRCGETRIVERLIDVNHLPAFHVMPLADAVDYAKFLIETTIKALKFEPGFPLVGGAVNHAIIRPQGVTLNVGNRTPL